MKIGVYVDGYNLYYGARGLCGRGAPGWRWLDVRALAGLLVSRRQDWAGAVLGRVVYCTARIDSRTNPGGFRDQDIYLKALVTHGSVDHIEYGRYVARAKRALLATTDAKGRPVVATSQWPIMVQNSSGADVPKARFMAQVLNLEEKGSDVNVATQLLLDVLGSQVDGAMVISNDSDLRLPVSEARKVVPVAVVNPGTSPLAGDLSGKRSFGVGNHWWYQLTATDVRSCQLPSPVGSYVRPNGW